MNGILSIIDISLNKLALSLLLLLIVFNLKVSPRNERFAYCCAQMLRTNMPSVCSNSRSSAQATEFTTLTQYTARTAGACFIALELARADKLWRV